VFFAASAALGKEFTKKIDKFVGLAAIVYISHISCGLQVIFDETDFINKLMDDNDVILQFPYRFKRYLGPELMEYFPRTSAAFIQSITGFNKEGSKLPLDRMSMIARFDTGGMCSKNMKAYDQMRFSGLFQQYDYGSPQENEVHYG